MFVCEQKHIEFRFRKTVNKKEKHNYIPLRITHVHLTH